MTKDEAIARSIREIGTGATAAVLRLGEGQIGDTATCQHCGREVTKVGLVTWSHLGKRVRSHVAKPVRITTEGSTPS
jgi:hypothetical protein